MITIGLIVNPVAGIGGAVGLKGSDGAAIQQQAKQLGGKSHSGERVVGFLKELLALLDDTSLINWQAVDGVMGGDYLQQMQIGYESLNMTVTSPTTDQDSKDIAKKMKHVDLLLFAGGDGTARDIQSVVGEQQLVLGIPGGVKIQSSVFAISPQAAARVVHKLAIGALTSVSAQEVRDLDEELYRAHQLQSKFFGSMNTPYDVEYIQHSKVGGVENDDMLINELADHVQELMEDSSLLIIGAGKTIDAICECLSLPNTLLGVDVVLDGQIVATDASASTLNDWVSKYPDFQLLVSATGGQGFIFGRGNFQFDQHFLKQLEPEHLNIVATKNKLLALENRPMLIDTNNKELNEKFSGLRQVIVGYHQMVLYPLNA